MSEPSTSTHQAPSPLPGRRSFLEWVTYLAGAVAALLIAVPFVGYLLGALRKTTPPFVNLGPTSKFPLNETRLALFENPIRQPWDGMTANTGVYVRNLGPGEKGEPRFLVFAMNCTHLGCPVTWFPQSGLFMCPCHGGVYYENGEHASGPPPRGLYHAVWEVSNAGELLVQAPHLPTLQDTLTRKEDA
jgi:Rieske Fe-S protein